MLIGYTPMRNDDPRGQFYNWNTRRAHVIDIDANSERELAAQLIDRQNVSTQLAGFSPDGRYAFVHQCCADEANYFWEREHQTFRMTEGWLVDCVLVDLRTDEAANPTAVDRVSHYNTGLFYWPGDDSRLGFQALIDGISHPFSMDRDGRNKRNLTDGTAAFTYGFSAAPGGRRICYHKNYQVHIANADGSGAVHVDTGHPFQFCPSWSPDGRWLTFLDGEHYDCHPTLVAADGTGARKLADRQGHSGVIEMLEHPDFHSASSDVPVWSPDSQWVHYTAMVDGALEMMRVSIDGQIERLTRSKAGTRNHHPAVSPDGRLVVFTSNTTGGNQLHVLDLATREHDAVTALPAGHMACHGHWGIDSGACK
jgi:Tol biopolymer transport system component